MKTFARRASASIGVLTALGLVTTSQPARATIDYNAITPMGCPVAVVALGSAAGGNITISPNMVVQANSGGPFQAVQDPGSVVTGNMTNSISWNPAGRSFMVDLEVGFATINISGSYATPMDLFAGNSGNGQINVTAATTNSRIMHFRTGVNGSSTVNVGADLTAANAGTYCTNNFAGNALVFSDSDGGGGSVVNIGAAVTATSGDIKFSGIGTVNLGPGTAINAAGNITTDGSATVPVVKLGQATVHVSPIVIATQTTLGGGLTLDINGTTAGGNGVGGYSNLRVDGGLTLGGPLVVTLASGFVPPDNSTYKIVDKLSAGAVTGTFTGLAENATFVAAFTTFRINYAAGDGNDVVLTALSTSCVPPNVFQDPASQTVCQGGTVTFATAATGTGLSYQWRKGTNPIMGATGTSYTIVNVQPGDAGTYDCVVTGSCGTDTSTGGVLGVQTAGAISQSPTSATRCVGQSVTFTGAATGNPAPVLQWQVNTGMGFQNIPMANGTSYTIPSVAAGNAGSYRLVATNLCGGANSTPATLTVNAPVNITQFPTSQSLCQGGTVTFATAATGTGLSYQWRKGTNPIVGATGTSFTIVNVQPGDAATYDCVITGTCSTETTPGAVLGVYTPPAISTSPGSFTRCSGQSVTFSVVATGTGLTYQWQRDVGAGFQNIGGAQTASYTIPSVVVGDAGSYRCVVSGLCMPPATSTSGVLTVNALPQIQTPPSPVTVCEGATVSLSVGAVGTGITYQWRRNTVPLANGNGITGATSANLQIASSTPAASGTYDVVVTGTCLPAVTSAGVAVVVNAYPNATIIAPSGLCASTNGMASVADAGPNATYSWLVTNGTLLTGQGTKQITYQAPVLGSIGIAVTVTRFGCARSSTTAVAVTSQLPKPVILPIDFPRGVPEELVVAGARTICEGAKLRLYSTAIGTSYQWSKNGNPIGGATASEYVVTTTTAADAGSYTLKAFNGACVSPESDPVLVAIVSCPGPGLSSLAPGCASTIGGRTVTLTGTNFRPDATVMLAGTPAAVQSLTSTQIVVTAGARAPGPAVTGNVVVTNDDGKSATLVNGFAYALRGDADNDGTLAPGDKAFLDLHLYGGGSPPVTLCSGDANSNGTISAADSFYLNLFFQGGLPPPGP